METRELTPSKKSRFELFFKREFVHGRIRKSVIIVRQGLENIHLWMEVPEKYEKWLSDDYDSLIILSLYHIMKCDGECFIHASMDRLLFENLMEFMRIWQLWCPQLYYCPKLITDALVDRVPANSRGEAVCAYSGGVDAAYSLLSHKAGVWGRASLDVSAAVMIHGADIMLEQETEFKYAYERAQKSLKGIDVELITVRTNCREVPQNWNHSHYSAVAAALSLFSAKFSRGLLGSDYVCSKEMLMTFLPYGMNYVTDRMLCSSAFDCRIVGSDVPRTQRCAFVSSYPNVMKNLRVCWQKDSEGGNCGVCEKCMRTALGFMAAGVEGEKLPFRAPFSLRRYLKLSLSRDKISNDALQEILDYDEKAHNLPPKIRIALCSKFRLSLCVWKLRRALATLLGKRE